jgi:Domain of unknown function (DUF4926)
MDPKLLDVVALLEDVPSQRLVRGQVGTVVENLGPGVFEVEFGDNEGRTYASGGPLTPVARVSSQPVYCCVVASQSRSPRFPRAPMCS